MTNHNVLIVLFLEVTPSTDFSLPSLPHIDRQMFFIPDALALCLLGLELAATNHHV